jgi:beta-glucosidase
MPISYPKFPNGITTYDYKPLEAFDLNKVEFLFEFGHGLSYTDFVYQSLKLNTTQLVISDNLSVKVTVKNVGQQAGKEVIILYLNDQVACVSRPNKQMKRFTKITLNKNETKEVEFILNKNDLSFISYDGKRIVEPGKFNIHIGNLTASFWLKNF